MTKVNLDTLKPWITRSITDILKIEDDVVIEFVYNQLEERVCTSTSHLLFTKTLLMRGENMKSSSVC